MKTIIYTGSFRFPIGDAGAPRVLNNAKILRDCGFNVIFISFGGTYRDVDINNDGNYYYQGFRYIISNDIDIKSSTFLKRIYNFLYSGHKAYKLIYGFKDSIDIIIAYNPNYYFTKKILKIAYKNNLKIITDITEWQDSNEFPGNKFAPPAWINNFNMKFTQKLVKNKILISSFLDQFYLDSHNVVLPPLADSTEPKWIDLKNVLPPFEGFRFLYAGTPAKKDLLETMLDAVVNCLQNNFNLQFVVVGVLITDISHYKNKSKYLEYPANIIFCGKVPQTDVPSYYNEADFSIIVREETRKSMAGFPTKLAETMMAGVPVILNYTSDIENYVKDGYNGFVIQNWSARELEKILIRILSLSKEDIEILKKNSKNCGYEKFDYKAYISNLNSFIINLY